MTDKTPIDVTHLMRDKLDTVYKQQYALNINYTMDELVIGQDYWINTILKRPVRGLNGYDPIAEETKADAANLYESEKVISTLTMSDLDEMKALVVDEVILEVASGKITDMTP